MHEQQQNQEPYGQLFWNIKAVIERIPGAFRLYKFVTSRTGEGKIYPITKGPLQGMCWKRYNHLPYWYHLGLYEPQLSLYMQQHLPPGGTFWDIGAHAGYHALFASRLVGEQGRVIAVEPDPATTAIIHEQLALNQVRHVDVLQMAVANEVGSITFMRSARDSRSSAIAGMGIAGTPLEVPTTTLDHLLEQYPAPDVLKMDIEGAEIYALPGGAQLFSGATRPKHLLIGVHGAAARRFTEEFVTAHGYTLVSLAGFDPAVILVAVAQPEGR